jgi:hypothetical protein
VEYDKDLLANAQKVLGTASVEDTIREAMREVLRNSPLFVGKISVNAGAITLPQQVLVRYGLDEPGAEINLCERKGGLIELRVLDAKP